MRVRRWFAADDGAYLTVLLLTVVVARALEFVWPAGRVAGLPLSTVALVVGAGATIAAWLVFRPRARWDRLTLVFLGTWAAAWALAVWASVRHSDVLDAALVVPPIAAALVATKRPSGPAVTRAIDVFAWSIAALCLGALLAQQVGLLDPATAGTATEWDTYYYWLPLNESLGIAGRWIGPFRTPNVTASAAAVIIVWGAARGWRSRVVLIGTGGLVLLLTGTRSSLFAAVVGVVALLVLTPVRARVYRLAIWTVGCLGALALLVGSMSWVRSNPTLTGRLDIWPVYLDLWRTDPAGGVGDAGVGLAVEDGRLPEWASHAHSVLIDPLARGGIVAALAVVAALALAIALAVRAARAGRPVGLAVVASMVVAGTTETLFDWRYLDFQLTALVAAALVAAAYQRVPGAASATQLGRRRSPAGPEADRRADAFVALDAAEAGAVIVRSRFGTPVTVHAKPGEDFATDVDLAAERAIREVIAHTCPDDAIVGEELGRSGPDGRRTWLVDPLCGTTNFASGLPLVATNVALTVDGRLVVGATCDPVHREAFWTDGTTAWRWSAADGPDVELRPHPGSALVGVGSTTSAALMTRLLTASTFAGRFRPVVVSSSLPVLWVADGRLAGYVQEGAVVDSVHFAAPLAVATAAGCVVSDLAGRRLGPGPVGVVVSADPDTHVALLAALGG